MTSHITLGSLVTPERNGLIFTFEPVRDLLRICISISVKEEEIAISLLSVFL